MPLRKAAGLAAVCAYVSSLSTVTPGGPAVVSVCASAQYALDAIDEHLRAARGAS